MGKEKLIAAIENGKQRGVRMIINCGGVNTAYTYAVQKINGKYIAFINEYDLDNYYEHELEHTEKIFVYGSLEELISNFDHKYGVNFEDFRRSKGQKFFNPDLYEQ